MWQTKCSGASVGGSLEPRGWEVNGSTAQQEVGGSGRAGLGSGRPLRALHYSPRSNRRLLKGFKVEK